MPVPEKDVEDSPPYSRHLVTDYVEDWLLNARVVKLRTTDLRVSGARPKVGPPVLGLRTGLTLESTGTAEALTHLTMSPSSTSTQMRSLQSERASQPVASQSQTLQPAGASQPVASQSQALQPEGASQPVASQSQAWWPQGASWPAASQTQALQPREDRWSVASQSPGHMPGATRD